VEVIPAIDLRGGQLVRLAQGDYARETIYDSAPERVAARFVAAGAPRLHVVDLDAARDGGAVNEPVIRAILKIAGSVPVQVGGGVRSLARVAQLLEAGAQRVVLGTAALEQPDLLREAAACHPGRIVLALDSRAGRVAVRGWRDTSALSAAELLARFEALPLAAVLHTDIERDGMLSGPNLESTLALARGTRLPVIASGGVGGIDDLVRMAQTGAIAGVVLGRALYEGSIDLARALATVAAAGAVC
jgi:phosphoribosylformimino-5-aminoimidazole carboxamide ribotide isomerase